MILCCFSNYHCAFTACVFEIVISITIWWHFVNSMAKQFSSALQLKDIFLLLIVTGWLVTLFTALFTLSLANKNRRHKYVWPRLIQLAGLLIVEVLLALLIAAYFSGGARSINNIILSAYEVLLRDAPLTTEERREAQTSLRYAFLLLIMLNFCSICYTTFQMWVAKKFYNELKRSAPPTTTLLTTKEQQVQLIEPTAPPMP